VEENKMKTWLLVTSALLSFACSSEPGGTPGGQKPSAAEPVGELSLELLGADRAGHPYRLRNATFQIYTYYSSFPTDGGDQTKTVSSDADPDATTIKARLLPGSYGVTLLNTDWFLEKVTPTGGERVAKSVLLSAVSQYAYIYNRSTTEVDFEFGVDGSLIDFRHGELNIGISVEHPDEDAGGDVDGGAP
jgi:hypothetical protein